MSKLIIYTPAYNAEKTLRRTVESVLNQIYTDFTYYLLDNASTDGTNEIISKYAERDKRIIPLFNEKNWGGNGILDVIKGHGDDCFLCELDADDEYTPDFLVKMIAFIQDNKLDIVACGSFFIDALTNRCVGERKLEQNLILQGDGFERYFPEYYQFMRTIWGKVYSISVLRRQEYKKYIRSGYGNDTLFAMNAFHNAKRIGIFADPLHKYYIYPKSISYQFDQDRIASDRILFDSAHDFLTSKCGNVSETSLGFLRNVYLNAIVDTLNVLLSTEISVSEKLACILDIFQSKHTQELIKWSGANSEKNQLISQVASWVLSREEVRKGSELDLVSDIFVAMNVYPSQIDGWRDGWFFILLTRIRDRQITSGLSSCADSQITSVVHKSPYLVGLDAGFLCYFRDIVFCILQNEEEKALAQIEELIVKQTEIPDEYAGAFLTLALNLSAKLELTDYFVFFKKLKISMFIDRSQIDEAIEELSDWYEILPDDIDFKVFKERLGI